MRSGTLADMLLADLLDLVLPVDCAGCSATGAVLCPSCAIALAAPARPCRPTPAPPGLPPGSCVGAYDGVLRAVLLAYKERGRTGAAGPLGAALARSVAAAVSAVTALPAEFLPMEPLPVNLRPVASLPVGLVPVPSRRAAVRARGGDHVLRLARAAARHLRDEGRPVRVVRALRHTGAARDSAGLDTAARAANVAGAFAVVPARLLGTGTLVLVDDLMTTGATLAAATAVLAAARARPVAIAVVAATARRPAGRAAVRPAERADHAAGPHDR